MELDPRNSDAAVGLGITHRELGHLAEALASFERALSVAPDGLRAVHEIGITLCEQRHYGDALTQFDRLLAQTPTYAPAHDARALALWRLGRLDEAERAYERAIEADPGFAAAYSNRGALRASRGQGTLARADYARAIELQPRHAEAHNGMGALLASRHQLDEAIACYHRAIDCRSSYAQAHNNLGVALADSGHLREAMASYDRAIELRDAGVSADALANRANLWARLRNPQHAAADARAALAIDPHHPYTLGNALYFESAQCDWRQRQESIMQLESGVASGHAVATPFVVLTLCDDPALQFAAARRFAAAHHAPQAEPMPAPAPNARIRVALVSADFHEHATAYLIAGMLEQFDKARFELFGLSFGVSTDDRYRRRLRAGFDR
ncbi:MAG: tetratricopeptide repeat protein, partial [Rubrivivax sp.]